jgi:hypothetical protein
MVGNIRITCGSDDNFSFVDDIFKKERERMNHYKPDGYHISKAKYRELSGLCLQYDELKQKLKDCYRYPTSGTSGTVISSSDTSGVERDGEKALRYSTVIELIESTVKETCGENSGMYPYILKAVTQGFTWERLTDCPCGRSYFYRLRRKFFYLLSQKK